MKVLFVLTSHDKLGDTGNKTGFWAEEFAAPYYYLADKGVDIALASPAGGKPPIDPTSEQEENQTEATKRFYNDEALQDKLSKTKKLSELNADDYDAVFYPGGHGPLWDLSQDRDSARLLQQFFESGKPTGLVCHAPAALKEVKTSSGDYLVKGRKVTGFTNGEEQDAGLSEVVPFLVEDMLKERGGEYSKGDKWSDHVVRDGNLLTGQNPASSEPAAEMLYQMLQKK